MSRPLPAHAIGRFATNAFGLALIFLAQPHVHAAPITLDMATVGNPGNAADTTGYGAVNYEYRIGKYEVTIGQYTDFLNSVDPDGTNPYGLYNNSMGTERNVRGILFSAGSANGQKYSPIGSVNRPITYVSWFDAARFANWMHNGQGTGSTETGAYSLNGSPEDFFLPPPRNLNAQFYIPTENEWYKAAYYSQLLNSGSGGYWTYATQSNTAPGNTIGGGANQANWYIGASPTGSYATGGGSWSPSKNYLTDVGAFTNSPSYYGTFDQSGNVAEWNDLTGDADISKGIRGGNWDEANIGGTFVSSAYRYPIPLANADAGIGFRLASPIAAANILFNIASGTQTQGAAGYTLLSPSNATSVEKTGPGTLILNAANTYTGPTTVSQGTLQLDNANALSTSAVTVAAGAKLSVSPQVQAVVPRLVNNGLVDVGLGGLTVTSGQTAQGIVAAIIAGQTNGTSGITSSVAATMADRAVGWLDNGDGSFTVAFAAAGDLNVNGVVDFDDVLEFVSSNKYDTGSPATWSQGDFDYSGTLDFDDVLAFVSAALYDKGAYNTVSAGMAVGATMPVPEPSNFALAIASLGCVGWSVLRRSRTES